MSEQTKALVKHEPSKQELAELQAFMGATGNDLTPAQVKLSWLYASKRGLDILAGQLTPTVMRGRLTFITRIDGFRVIAERSGDYAGQDPIVYGYKESGSGKKLEWAEATVYRHSWGERGLTVRAYWDEYCPDAGKDFTWKKMPHVMLGKVAEAAALRKAFPNDMSGMYSDDEMAQAGVAPAEATADYIEGEVAEAEQRQEAAAAATADERDEDEETEKARPKPKRRRRKKGMTDEEWQAELEQVPVRDLTPAEADFLKAQLEKQAQAEAQASADDAADEADNVIEGHFVPVDDEEGLPDADVDPTRGGSTEIPDPSSQPEEKAPEASGTEVNEDGTQDATLPDAPDAPYEPEPQTMEVDVASIPVAQGDEGEPIVIEAIYVQGERITTPKGNPAWLCWVAAMDGSQRYECMMAMQVAEQADVTHYGRGEPVRVQGTWTNAGDRLVVVARMVRA